MIAYIYVALGGALGASLRYAISQVPFSSSFPVATLLTNVLGAFIIGYISSIAVQKGISDQWVLFLKTGLCGGFTTFSTFSLESVQLLNEGKVRIGIAYIVASLLLCMIGVFCGQYCANKFF